MMVATNHLPGLQAEKNHCPFGLEMLAWVWIWWLGYIDAGWIGGGRGRWTWLGLDSLTGLVWLGSLLADHRLGVVTGHVVELDTVAKQQNNSGSASGI
jgi:hypothetical protein